MIKGFKQFNEEKEIKEFFGSLPFKINTTAWQSKGHDNLQGKGEWEFEYKVPVSDEGISYIDDGIFSFKGKYKDALKALHKFLKSSYGGEGNIKQSVVKLIKRK